MSEITTPTDETTEEALDNYELPSDEEIRAHMNELEARGVPVEHECHDCDATFPLRTLPEETDGINVSLCRDCMTDHLREEGLL